MRVSVIVFPGSNCDHDVEHVSQLVGHVCTPIWHKSRDLQRPDIVVVPGGFSYGDYLRTGALAKLSPIMDEVRAFAERGGPILGICNGFQILCEAGLLPGVLLKNRSLRFLSQFVHLRVERQDTFFTQAYASGSVLTCPIAHGDGNYFADPATLEMLEGEGQVIFRYSDPAGHVDAQSDVWNPNGSCGAIAGICNKKRNIVGMMPHPERAAEAVVGAQGGAVGRAVFAGVA